MFSSTALALFTFQAILIFPDVEGGRLKLDFVNVGRNGFEIGFLGCGIHE